MRVIIYRPLRPSLRLRARALAAGLATLGLALAGPVLSGSALPRGVTPGATPGAATRDPDMPVPVEQQLALLLRVLSMDRTTETLPGREIVVGVVFQSRYRLSLTTRDQVQRAAAQAGGIGGRSVRIVPIELADAASLPAQIRAAGAHAAYVTPLRAVDVRAVAGAATGARVVSLTGVPAYVRSGVAVGIGEVQQRPQILVNLPAARAAGAQFSARLLQLATVIE